MHTVSKQTHPSKQKWLSKGSRWALALLVMMAVVLALLPAGPVLAHDPVAASQVSDPIDTTFPVERILVVNEKLALALTQDGELYRLDIDTMRWTAVAGLPNPSPGGFALLPDGNVLLIAGKNEQGRHLANAVYDPAKGTFTEAAPWPGSMGNFPSVNAVTLPDGRVLVIGHYSLYGQEHAFAYFYDAAKDLWQTADKLDFAGEALVMNRRGHVLNYVGGINDYFPAGTLYDGERFLTISSLPYGLRFSGATSLADGSFFLAGGSMSASAVITPSRAALVFLPDRNEWHVRAFMQEARAYPAAALLPDGRVLVAGGIGDAGRLATTEIYDPAMDRWIAGPALSRAYDHLRIATLPGGDLLVVGSQSVEDGPGDRLVAERLEAERLPAGTAGRGEGKPNYDLNTLPVKLRGVPVHRETLFTDDGWTYRSEWMYEDDHYALFHSGDVVFTRAYMTRTNEQGRKEIVIDGRHEVLRLEGDRLYVMQDGYLKRLKLGERYGEVLRFPERFRVDNPEDPRWSVLGRWEAHAGMPIRLGMNAFDGEYFYTWWATAAAPFEPGYPVRVHYTGSHLQVLSAERGTAYRGELRLDGDWVTYLTAKPDAREWSRNQPHILHAVKKDGSAERDLAAVFGGYTVHGGHIYYTSADDPLDTGFPAGKLYRMNMDGSGKRLLSAEGAGQLHFVGDQLYFQTFDTGTIYRMNPDGSERKALFRGDGNTSYQLVEMRPNALIFNEYGGPWGEEWLGTYQMDLASGKVTAHDQLERPVQIRIDGVYHHFGREPVFEDGTVFVPLRGILEALGARVTWDGGTGTVSAEKDGVNLRIAGGDVFVNGNKLDLARGPMMRNGTTLVPVRVISETLRAEVTWVGRERTVNIMTD